MTGLAGAGISRLRAAFANATATPEEATADCLAAIAAGDGAIGAFVLVDTLGAHAAAVASARRWRVGAPRSVLDGVPVAIKANIAVAGLPWHAGIAAYRARVAPADAACVARLRAAGCVLLGLTNMHEGALGGTTDNPWFGRTDNPAAPGHTAGGSSGGSAAAVAAGFCTAALGTDTLGSVRIPSAYCGGFGHRPSPGLVSSQGVVPLSAEFDTVGIHAASAEDCALVLAALAGTAMPTLAPGTLGVLDLSGQVDIAPAIAAACQGAAGRAAQAGWRAEHLRLPDIDLGRLRRRALLLLEIEAESVHRAALQADPDGFSSPFRHMLAWAMAQPAASVAAAREELRVAAASLHAAFAPFDAILAPTTPHPAFAWTAPVPANQADLTLIASAAGLAATAAPVGAAGPPLSVQAIARCDATALTLAAVATSR